MKIVIALLATCALASVNPIFITTLIVIWCMLIVLVLVQYFNFCLYSSFKTGLMAEPPLHSDPSATNTANHDATPETAKTPSTNQREAAPLLKGNKEKLAPATQTNGLNALMGKNQKPPAAPAVDTKYKMGLVVPSSVKQTNTTDKKIIPASPKVAPPSSSSAAIKPKTNKTSTEQKQPSQKANKLASNILVADAPKPGSSAKSSSKAAAQLASQNANKTTPKPTVNPVHVEDAQDVKWATKSVRKFFRTMIDMMDWDNLHVSSMKTISLILNN